MKLRVDYAGGAPSFLRVMAASLLAVALTTAHAKGAEFELIYSGVFNNQDALNAASSSSASYFTAATPFTISAFFDTSSPNLAPAPPGPGPFSGFRAYAPSSASIMIGNATYSIDTINQNSTAGITVAIFDQNSFTSGHYAVGILQQPPLDGAGIIGDFTGATPDFMAGAVTPTVFTGYYGVGYGSGVCTQGSGANCRANAITPLVLRDGANNVLNLTLGNYDEDSVSLFAGDVPGPLNSAQLVATPEPNQFAIAVLSLAGILSFARARKVLSSKV